MIATLSSPAAPGPARIAASPRPAGTPPTLAPFPDLTVIGAADEIAVAGERQFPTGNGNPLPEAEGAPAWLATLGMPASLASPAADEAAVNPMPSPPPTLGMEEAHAPQSDRLPATKGKAEAGAPKPDWSPATALPTPADVAFQPSDIAKQPGDHPARAAAEPDSDSDATEASPDQPQPIVFPTFTTTDPIVIPATVAASPTGTGAMTSPGIRPDHLLPAGSPVLAGLTALPTPDARADGSPTPAPAAIPTSGARPEPLPATDPVAVAQTPSLARDPALAAVHGPVEIEIGAPPAALSPPQRAPVAAPATPAAASPAPALATGASAPAGQVFAAALHAAARDERTERDTPARDTAPLPALGATDLAPSAVTAPAQTADTGGGTLDLRDGRWPHAMMDHIERLRDDADAADTRIRLIPDRLGPVDVAVRREGDTLHVRFHAAEAETRALLADAQPRLAEIAQGRGLRLGDAQVGGGAAQGERQPPRPAPVPATPAAPRPVTQRADDELSTDIRIA